MAYERNGHPIEDYLGAPAGLRAESNHGYKHVKCQRGTAIVILGSSTELNLTRETSLAVRPGTPTRSASHRPLFDRCPSGALFVAIASPME